MNSSNSFAKRRLIANATANLIGFAAAVVITFLLSPILIGGLGERPYGFWVLVESVLAYLSILDFGLSSSIVRYVAKFEACEDQDSLNRVFSTTLCLFGVSGLFVLAISVGLALLWPEPDGMPADLIQDIRWLFFLLGLNLALGFPLGTYSAVLDGLGRYPAKVSIRTFAMVVRALLAWAVIVHGGGLVALALVTTGVNVVEHLAMVLAAKLYMPRLRFSFAGVSWETFRSIRGYSFAAFVAMIAGRISFQTDAVVIAAFMLPEEITFFAMAARLIDYGKSGLRSLTMALTPAFSALEARNDYSAIQRIFFKATRYVFYMAIPAQLGCVMLGNAFFTLWLGPEFGDKSYPVLVILSLPLALVLSQSISGRLLYGIGQLRWFATATIVEALFNLALSLAWVQSLGIEGVAWGTAVPNVLFNLALIIYVCRTLHVPITEFLRRSLLGPLILASLPALCWWGLSRFVELSTWGAFVTVSVSGLAIHGLAVVVAEYGLPILLAGKKVAESKTKNVIRPASVNEVCHNPE